MADIQVRASSMASATAGWSRYFAKAWRAMLFSFPIAWFRDLKYKLGLVNLHGMSDAFAEQEIYAALTAFSFASRVCQEVVIR